ncbi:MAG: LexA family protein, partial [Rhodospirillaceae bacterium]
MLTSKQRQLLDFIDARLRATGVSPSFDEMKEALNLKSKSGIHRLIKGLEERGFLRRLPYRARALEVVRRPEDASSGPAGAPVPPSNDAELPDQDSAKSGSVTPFSPKVIRGGFQNTPPPAPPAASPPSNADNREQPGDPQTVTIPVLGKIAAGLPIEALSNHGDQIDIPASMVSGGEHFALIVEGESMIEAGILDGDTAILKKCDTAENGSIVCALVKGEETTLKRLRRRSAAIALEPANASHRTQIYQPSQVAIQGKL